MSEMIPRCEHPRPDRKREAWLNLNGEWSFETDNAKSGIYKSSRREESLTEK